MDTSSINLLELIGKHTSLKKVASTDGGEYAGSCPFCGGTDRFRVWPNENPPRFWCRQCERTGDAIQYVQLIDGVDFKGALGILGLNQDSVRPAAKSTGYKAPDSLLPRVNDLRTDYPALNDAGWQNAATEFCNASGESLNTQAGNDALGYLRNDRYLTDEVIQSAQIGYNPEDHAAQWGNTSVWLPRGIVIPWWIGNQIWRVNIRRLGTGHEHRYKQPSGGANGLYGADSITLHSTVIVTEGEFDARVIESQTKHSLPDLVTVATGSVAGAQVLRWALRLNLASKVLLAFDADEAGDQGATFWQGVLGQR